MKRQEGDLATCRKVCFCQAKLSRNRILAPVQKDDSNRTFLELVLSDV